MRKIVCLIRPAPHTTYFVNRLHRSLGVSLVVCERVERPYGWRRSLKNILDRRALLAVMHDQMRAGTRRRAERDTFGTTAVQIDPEIEVLQTDSINSHDVVRRLSEERPDILVDHGTSIVRDEVLATAERTLNLHWGLSPYYRGVRCTEWALINWDAKNIGVTVHELTRKIDGGPIWAQGRVEVSRGDTVHTINMKLTVRGTDIIVDTLRRMESGGLPDPQPQQLDVGFLTLSRQWSPDLSAQIRRIETTDAMERMLRHPSRPPLPIVQPDWLG